MSNEYHAHITIMRRPWLLDAGLAQVHDLRLEPALHVITQLPIKFVEQHSGILPFKELGGGLRELALCLVFRVDHRLDLVVG